MRGVENDIELLNMDINHNIDIAKGYLEGMLWAAYGVKIISGSVAEWQID